MRFAACMERTTRETPARELLPRVVPCCDARGPIAKTFRTGVRHRLRPAGSSGQEFHVELSEMRLVTFRRQCGTGGVREELLTRLWHRSEGNRTVDMHIARRQGSRRRELPEAIVTAGIWQGRICEVIQERRHDSLAAGSKDTA